MSISSLISQIKKLNEKWNLLEHLFLLKSFINSDSQRLSKQIKIKLKYAKNELIKLNLEFFKEYSPRFSCHTFEHSQPAQFY